MDGSIHGESSAAPAVARPDDELMPEGWRAALELRFVRQRTRTILADRRQYGPLTVQRPFHPEGDAVCHTYLLHPPAGIVGGDSLTTKLHVDQEAHVLVTTPGATRWYFSRERPASACQTARVEDGGTLEWLPQEALIFDGAHARLTTRVDLRPSAKFLGWETLGLGRPACGEDYTQGSLDFRFELLRDGQPVLLENLRSGDGGVAGLRGNSACSTLIAAPVDGLALECARAVSSDTSDALCAPTLIGDVLVWRGMASRCEPLVRTLGRLWAELRPIVLGRDAVAPRIWRT